MSERSGRIAPAPRVDPQRNRILALLPRAAAHRLEAEFEVVPLASKRVLQQAWRPVDAVYFPLDAVVSLLVTEERGRPAEITTIGSEGFIGLPILFGTETSAEMAVVQIPGTALRLSATTLHAALAGEPALRVLLLRYAQALFTQLSQSVACNARHALEQRCASWLLATHDRARREAFPITQESLAQMLGVRRPSINLIATTLQDAGLIRYRHGVMTIVDAARLEGVGCVCYRIVKTELDRLLPPTPSAGG